MRDKIIYLDMDGVLVNFTKGLLEAHGRDDLLGKAERDEYPTDWWYGGELGSEEELWEPVLKTELFWYTLEPTEWMDSLINIVKEFDTPWYICTTPYDKDSNSYGQKVDWLKWYFGDDFNRFIMMKDKYLLAHPNAILIDDNDNNCIKFEENGGKSFLYPMPWNEARAGIPYRLELIRGSLHNWINERDHISGIRKIRVERY